MKLKLKESAAAIAAVSLVLAATAIAKDKVDYPVNKLKYENHGAYTAEVYYAYDNGGQNPGWPSTSTSEKKSVDTGKSRTFDLDNATMLKKGREVWLKVEIGAGLNQNCKKDHARFVYDPEGSTATFKTSGTTLQNNRCKIVCKQC